MSPKNGRAGEGAMKKRAAAHAHYAAGVVHELNDEPELALREFQKAALDDPADETLILDVSQRFLQNRQPEKALELLLATSARPEVLGGGSGTTGIHLRGDGQKRSGH